MRAGLCCHGGPALAPGLGGCREVNPGTLDSLPRPCCRAHEPPAEAPWRAQGWGQARVCPHRVLGGLGHILSESWVPASQNGHQHAPLCGLLEGFVRPGAWPRGAGVGWLTLSWFAFPLRPLSRRRPGQRQRGRRRGADTDAPAGCREHWRGPPRHAGCRSGFPEQLRGAPGEKGGLGSREALLQPPDTRGQHGAGDGAASPRPESANPASASGPVKGSQISSPAGRAELREGLGVGSPS